jgi:hypothetical protein
MKFKEMNVWFSDLLDYDWVGGGTASPRRQNFTLWTKVTIL